ncbi:hypothetical protein H6P81_004150 [Aristolochia fimbriata]|uniref:Glycosyltransferase 61 catalytic domain-containing protein n=1 Tax=Aristolochia fimbriata TaxID=158543 RepID=A0AAV7FHA6_ARIFI|nr:hypothetical protein H6P81_004150 [Aristolochia fimbriata]
MRRFREFRAPSLRIPLKSKSIISLLRFSALSVFLLYSTASVLNLRLSFPQPPPQGIGIIGIRDDQSILKFHFKSTKPVLLEARKEEQEHSSHIPCSSFINGISVEEIRKTKKRHEKGILCCDRSHYRTDICYMRGDIRTVSESSSILLHDVEAAKGEERIRPYTRKWETGIMDTVDELRLRPINGTAGKRRCDVEHRVPAVVMSTGGYTGNVYHEFNDGLLPLFLTAERFKGEVAVVAVEFHRWWLTKYEAVLQKLTNYPVVDFSGDPRVHCFPEIIVGTKIHGELAVDPSLANGKTIHDFRALLARAFQAPPSSDQAKIKPSPGLRRKPTIAIFTRDKSRRLLNLKDVEKICRRTGFEVVTLNPKKDTPVSALFAALDSADAMLGVHGAALTHLLFMNPGSVFVQIVPLGLDWAAAEYYGDPAKRLGLVYVAYNVTVEESSLSGEYGSTDPVLVDPASVNKRGWTETKRVYLEKQNVRVDLRRFRRVIERAYSYVIIRSKSRYRRRSPA